MFEWKFGPAFIVSCFAVIISTVGTLLAAGIYVGQQQSGGEASVKSIRELKVELAKQSDAISAIDRRTTETETILKIISRSVERIEARQFGDVYRAKPQ